MIVEARHGAARRPVGHLTSHGAVHQGAVSLRVHRVGGRGPPVRTEE